MGLKRKGGQRQLEARLHRTIWPGDSAVDVEASGLVAWCQDGEEAGLELRPDVDPAHIVWRELDDLAMTRVSSVGEHGWHHIPSVAFRHGVQSIGGHAVRRTRIGDAAGLSDDTMREMEAHAMRRPFLVAIAAMN